jgi:hypothetical protein
MQQTFRSLLSCHVSGILIFKLQITNSQVLWLICFHQSWQVLHKNHISNLLFSEIRPIWNFTKRRMVVNNISVKIVGPNIICQAVQEMFDLWKWDQGVFPKHQPQTNILRCVTSQKSVDIFDRAADVWNRAQVFLCANGNTSYLTHNIHDKTFEEIFTARFFGSYRLYSWQRSLESELKVDHSHHSETCKTTSLG